MMKNALDVVFGGISFWAFGFGLSFGGESGSNPFTGVGCFFVDAEGDVMGDVFAVFLFQLSFATTATTIVSGAMAERAKLHAYLAFCIVNTFTFSIVAHWMWSENGFLHTLGAIDAAGCGPVHLVGGATGLVATVMLKPRSGVFDHKVKPTLPSPLKALLGMFMLWWGWLRFCSGSIFIVSASGQWKSAVRAAVNTMVSSMGGGITGVLLSILMSARTKRTRYDVATIINSVLGSLVSITGICTLCRAWESLVIGIVGAFLSTGVDCLVWRARIDDPVGVIAVHGACAIWGLIAVGLFVDPGGTVTHRGGLLRTGDPQQLVTQLIAVASILGWTIIMSFILLKTLDLVIGLRLDDTEEKIGADIVEHGLPKHGHWMAGNIKALQRIATCIPGSMKEEKQLLKNPADIEADNAFNTKIAQILHDLAKSCDRNMLTLTFSEQNGRTFHLTLNSSSSNNDASSYDASAFQSGI